MRQAVGGAGRSKTKIESVPAPITGLVRRSAGVPPDPAAAEVLENWIPTKRGARVRGGKLKSATVGSDPITSMFSYEAPSSSALFAATLTSVYDVSSLDADNAPLASIVDQTAGYYSAQQFGTPGGSFLYIVNGADLAWIYDGSAFNPVTDAAINNVPYDGLTSEFSVGETVTGGMLGATAEIIAIIPASATEGVLKVGTISGAGFNDNENLTSATGAAVANGASSVASSAAITGVDTSSLSFVWSYGSRLFFVEKDTFNAWYLDPESIGGAASEFSLASVFERGGALMFGGSWSIDAGDGADDKCVFVSTEGEVAIYSGADPSSASSFALEGRYDIAKPLGINGFMRAGGDFLIATEDGIVPLTEVFSKDTAALSLSPVMRNIEPLWAFEASRNTGSIELVKWDENRLAMVVLPSADRALTVNLQTGAWAIQEGWSMDSAAVFNGRCFGGFSDGAVRALDETGTDDGVAFTARYCGAYWDLGRPGTYKTASMARPVFYSEIEFNYSVSVSFDFETDFGAAPNSAINSDDDDFLVWDQGKWGQRLWETNVKSEIQTGFTPLWRAVDGAGFAMAPMLQITSAAPRKLDIELIRFDLTYQEGSIQV